MRRSVYWTRLLAKPVDTKSMDELSLTGRQSIVVA